MQPLEEQNLAINLNNNQSQNQSQSQFINIYRNSDGYNCRNWGLGDLRVFDDGLIIQILSMCSPLQLESFALVSRAFYILSNEEEIWKRLCFSIWDWDKGIFIWKGNWKTTTISIMYETRFSPVKINSKDKKLYTFDRNDKEIPYASGFESGLMHRRWIRKNYPIQNLDISFSHIERHSVDRLSYSEFVEQFDKICKPVIITDFVSKWPAMQLWTEEKILEKYSSTIFRMTHKQNGHRVRMRGSDYFYYWKNQRDLDPLYLFESKFALKTTMAEDYEAPSKYFGDDLFEMLPKRPFYRWLIIGPARSGTSFHIDPICTSAWNALVSGRKRWALYPPGWREPPGKTSHLMEDKFDSDVEPLHWYLEVYPNLPPTHKPWECIQRAGEMIFVPGGWWHSVLNLDETVAVTHNFVTESIFPRVWNELKERAEDEPEDDPDRILLNTWIEKLKVSRPDLLKQVNYSEDSSSDSDSNSGSDSDSDSNSNSNSNSGSGSGSNSNSDCEIEINSNIATGINSANENELESENEIKENKNKDDIY
eukprot:TRINITY_DN5310_c0_g1_i1.p1 TRINITY_DN5310_c0_g1~~TRINITY_DN5310_c0_g1_i1.p1  ORF type:complete len:553 (-),score=257.64 TRINITY_DN5310_c0_g1_i1:69-1676(-)